MSTVLDLFFHQHASLQKKMMSILLILTVIPFLIIFIFVYVQQSKLIDQTVSGAANHEFRLLSEHINSILFQASETSSRFFLDEDIGRLLSWKPDTEAELRLRKQQLENCMRRYSANISSISFYTALLDLDSNIYGTGLKIEGLSYDQLTQRSWFSRFSRSSFEIVWTTDSFLNEFFVSSPSECFYIIRQMKNLDTWEDCGLLILAIPNSQLIKSSIGYVQDNVNFYILDGAKVIASFGPIEFGKGYAPSHPEVSTFSESSFITSISDRRYLVNSGPLSRSRWLLVTYTDYLTQLASFSYTKTLYLLLICFYIPLACFLSYQSSKRFLAPVKHLHKSMQAVKKGNLNVTTEVSSHDEIGDLSVQFNDMLAQINILMDNIVQEENAKRKSEIMALQAQINPHFLYNTLASVRYMIYAGDKKNADLVILALIKLMKNATSADHLNTVENELDLLQNYISIQQFTFDNPILVQVDVQDEIKNCRVLKMILQPIVENAILHGLKPKKGDKSLTIKGYRTGGLIEFQIIDNGVGFDVSKLPGESKCTPVHSSIAISNVSSRLRLYFGSGYDLTFQSTPEQGTCVTIPFPYIEEEEFSVYEHFDR